jgi:hypothetical protein
MTDASVSPLRQRLIDDMTIRHFAPRTQQAYIRSLRRFSAFLGATRPASRTCAATSSS